MVLTGQLNGFSQVFAAAAEPALGDTVTYAGFLYQNTACTLLPAGTVRCDFTPLPTLTAESGVALTTEAGDGIGP